MKNQTYIHYFSVLKIIAMFSVIGLHTFCTPVNIYNSDLSKIEVFIGVFISQFLLAWAVPVFVMVSGALFLDKEKVINLKKIYCKYILRLVLILLTFGTMYALMEPIYTEHTFNFHILIQAFKNMYSGNSWAHMWFIYMIIGLYICTPPIRLFISKASEDELKYLILMLCIFLWLIPFIEELTKTKFGIDIPFKSQYLLYYIMGYAIHNKIIKINYRVSIIFILFGLLWCSVGQFIPSILNGEPNFSIKYLNFVSFPLSIGIFSLAKENCKDKINWIDTKLVPLSLGVYVVHQLFLNIFFKILHITPDNYNIWFCWITVFIGTSICSIMFVWLIKKNPFINKWIF